MISPLTATLWITLIGMGLVFIAILLLWGIMEVMVRFSMRFGSVEKHEFAAETGDEEETEELAILTAPSDHKKRAASAAVAIALALRQGMRRATPAQSTGSAWQAVNRTRQLTQPTHLTRKS